jgi:hypothetical protein
MACFLGVIVVADSVAGAVTLTPQLLLPVVRAVVIMNFPIRCNKGVAERQHWHC